MFTHGEWDTYDAAELPARWLLDPDIVSKRGMVVEVKGSFGTAEQTKWHNGDYEGMQGVVLSVFDTHNEHFQRTARVRFEKSLDPTQSYQAVPVDFLWPVHPDKLDEEVMILPPARHKGQEAKVHMVEHGGDMVITTKTYMVLETNAEKLVRIWNIDDEGNRIRA